MIPFLKSSVALCCVTACAAALSAAELPKPRKVIVKPASTEGALAMKRFNLADGLSISLTAAEPLLANPVAFDIDEHGNFYVVECFRLHKGVTDIRQHMNWLDEELASQSTGDMLAMYERHKVRGLTDYSDRLRRLSDTDGDGVLDHATVFADGFNSPADGLAAGVLARYGKVWFTNLPHLWLLEDRDNDGVADSRQSLASGFGVRVGFLGHDLHGLRLGPDGRIYFSIGDRAASVTTLDGRKLHTPETGAIYRCELDGTGLEIFHYGLRNPQELAFDQLGTLFTGDNNSDGGDPARWVHA
ncbi:MAG: glucose dehydrogenase, partial [Verrucomicrobia bacterium]|nr:glucose dehydrogenase [Verrucomicrobiota bacterium]